MSTFPNTCGTSVGRFVVIVLSQGNCRCVFNIKEVYTGEGFKQQGLGTRRNVFAYELYT